MSQITLDLPEDIAAEIERLHIFEDEICRVALIAIRKWLDQRAEFLATISENASVSSSQFSDSAKSFAKRIIAQNRELFEELAKLPDDNK